MNPDGSIVDNLFGTRSKEYHSKSLRPIQKLYSLRSSLELEPIMNGTVQALCNELEHRFMQDGNEGATCDIGQWISFFTWDFLGDMTFSKRFGFMKTGTDVENIVESAEKVMRYFSVVRLHVYRSCFHHVRLLYTGGPSPYSRQAACKEPLSTNEVSRLLLHSRLLRRPLRRAYAESRGNEEKQ
jgi:hypothetical protein